MEIILKYKHEIEKKLEKNPDAVQIILHNFTVFPFKKALKANYKIEIDLNTYKMNDWEVCNLDIYDQKSYIGGAICKASILDFLYK